MSKKDFRLVRPVKDAYSTREVGYEDTFDYPNLYDEKTGEVGICGGHGIYAWAQREDYELINQNKEDGETDHPGQDIPNKIFAKIIQNKDD
jgi:hypothetical protein